MLCSHAWGGHSNKRIPGRDGTGPHSAVWFQLSDIDELRMETTGDSAVQKAQAEAAGPGLNFNSGNWWWDSLRQKTLNTFETRITKTHHFSGFKNITHKMYKYFIFFLLLPSAALVVFFIRQLFEKKLRIASPAFSCGGITDSGSRCSALKSTAMCAKAVLPTGCFE